MISFTVNSGIRKLALLLVVVLCSSLVTAPVHAADDYPENCEEAPVLTEGTYTGSLSPADEDAMIFDLDDGESVTVSLTWEETKNIVVMNENTWDRDRDSELDYSAVSLNLLNGGYSGELGFVTLGESENDNNPTYMEIYSEGEAPACVGFAVDEKPVDSWKLVVDTAYTPTPTATATYTPTPTPKLTFTPTETPTLTPDPTATPTETEPLAETPQEPTPTERNETGVSGQDSDNDGVVDSEDYAPNDPNVQDRSDVQLSSGQSGPGFGVGMTVVALLVSASIAVRRS